MLIGIQELSTTIKILFAFILLIQCGVGQNKISHLEFTHPIYGTSFTAILYHENKKILNQLKPALTQKLIELEKIFSTYIINSELNQLAELPIHQSKTISDELFECLTISQNVYQNSQGRFDPSIAYWTNAWKKARGNIGKGITVDHLPNYNFSDLHLTQPNRVNYKNKAFALDLGGIAKGYALDQLAKILQANQCIIFYLSLGGEVLLGKAPPNQKHWRIACEGPNRRVTHYLELSEMAVSSSGSSYQFLYRDGKKISHLYHPKNQISSNNPDIAYIIATKSSYADAWATVLQVSGSTNILNPLPSGIKWGGLLTNQGWRETTGPLP